MIPVSPFLNLPSFLFSYQLQIVSLLCALPTFPSGLLSMGTWHEGHGLSH